MGKAGEMLRPGSEQAGVVACALVIVIAVGSYCALEIVPATLDRCTGRPMPGANQTIVSFNNRTYCGQPMNVELVWTFVINATFPILRGPAQFGAFLDYYFLIVPWYTPGESWLNTTIVEPSASVHYGGPYWTGVYGGFSNTWFTPDNQSGVDVVSRTGETPQSPPTLTVLLLVEVGA